MLDLIDVLNSGETPSWYKKEKMSQEESGQIIPRCYELQGFFQLFFPTEKFS